MGTWPQRVPKDERVYDKHESVQNNPKIADVAFRSGDIESWGRGFLKIKAECKSINAPLPVIDAENGGVSIRATGCEKYMSILRYGQYGQVGADGVRREKEAEKHPKSAEDVPKSAGVTMLEGQQLIIYEYVTANKAITTMKA